MTDKQHPEPLRLAFYPQECWHSECILAAEPDALAALAEALDCAAQNGFCRAPQIFLDPQGRSFELCALRAHACDIENLRTPYFGDFGFSDGDCSMPWDLAPAEGPDPAAHGDWALLHAYPPSYPAERGQPRRLWIAANLCGLAALAGAARAAASSLELADAPLFPNDGEGFSFYLQPAAPETVASLADPEEFDSPGPSPWDIDPAAVKAYFERARLEQNLPKAQKAPGRKL